MYRKPLPEKELDIGRRVLDARCASTFLRTSVAKMAGIDSSILMRIELCRVRARYEPVKKIAEILDVNQRWLAEGKEPRRPYIPIERDIECRIPPRILFSQAYVRFLQPTVEGMCQFLKILNDLGLDIRFLLKGDEFPKPMYQRAGVWIPRPEWLPAQKKLAERLRFYAAAFSEKAEDVELGIGMSEDQNKTPPAT